MTAALAVLKKLPVPRALGVALVSALAMVGSILGFLEAVLVTQVAAPLVTAVSAFVHAGLAGLRSS